MSPAGFIVLIDIVDFSLLVADEQERCVRALWAAVEGHGAVTSNSEVLHSGTGDGILSAFPRNGVTVPHHVVLEFAEAVAHAAEAHTPPFHIRVGVHEGEFARLHGLGSLQVVGTGPNECARVCSIGDGGHIVVSEEFVASWAKQSKGIHIKFQPSEPDHPVEVFVKHGVSMRVRLFRRARADQPVGADEPVPRKFVVLDAVEARIRRILEEVEQLVLGEVAARLPRSNGLRERLSIRTSLCATRSTDGVTRLVPTDYRFNHAKDGVGKGVSQYRVQPAEGPPGAAYATGAVQAVVGLPAYERARPNAYLEHVERELNVPREVARRWQRHARSFLSVPFGLTSSKVDGVLCIDILDPLVGFPRDDLLTLGALIEQQYAVLLAALWAVRI